MIKLTQRRYNMNIKPIHTEEDYQHALARVNEIFDAPLKTPDGDELEILSILIERFEDRNFPMQQTSPIEAIQWRMEQLNMKPVDLAYIIGYKSRVSEIFSGRRKLSLSMIRKINKYLHIPMDVLIQEY